MTEAPASLALALKRGGDVFVVEHGEEFVTLDSSAPSPPGSTLEATRAHVTLRVKVRSCRRHDLPNGRQRFRIEGRFVSLSRADREFLFSSRAETDPGSTSET